jgi:REP element-mobilizing transposase RayT
MQPKRATNPTFHHRQSIRLKEYDYSQAGYYFITICTYQRQCLFGTISNGQMELSANGEIAASVWINGFHRYSNIVFDDCVVMPNHMHGILQITLLEKEENSKPIHKNKSGLLNVPNEHWMGTKSDSVGSLIQNYKSVTTRKINMHLGTPGMPVWQHNYYERIIRNEKSLMFIRNYILNNPANWLIDEMFILNP